MKDIAQVIGLDEVKVVVDDFYNRIQRHPTLARPFQVVADWPEHKAHLTHFWWVTLGGAPYRDRPYKIAEVHEAAGFTTPLLKDWLALFEETLHDHLAPEMAQLWLRRATKIGATLQLMHESLGWRYRKGPPGQSGTGG